MPQRPFVHADTVRKLDTVADYAEFYTRALSRTGMKLRYLDAFAGTGQIPLAQELPPMAETLELASVVRGSALRALEVTIPFDEYVFADIKRSNTEELDELKAKYPSLSSRIFVRKGEANDIVLSFCASLSNSDRALVFLDPFGNQVSWSTLEVIARTKKIDLWYLFPAGLGVVRQVANRGEILSDAEQSLDRMFGAQDWRTECVKYESEPDLFVADRIVAKKIATAEGITRYMIGRMETIFEGGVSDRWLPLGRNGIHQFSLLFACANPGEKARSLAQRVAREIMKRR
jgi:three-Cys-motif partner protein